MSTGATTENCRFCWMCRQACPVGHVTHRETLTPHAWALTIESVARGQLSWNDETVGVIYACADCGLCQSHCVTDQALPDAIVAARTAIVEDGLAPEAVHALDRRLRAYGSAYATTPSSPLRGTHPTALFVGDGADALGRDAVSAAVDLLRAAGTDVTPIGVGRASGLTASAVGLRDTARSLGRAILAEIAAAGVRELVVLTPGDRWVFEHVYPRRLGLEWPEAVVIKDATAILAEALVSGRLRLRAEGAPAAYAYHDPCHSPRVSRDPAGPRALLRAVLGEGAERPLFWRETRAHPCGAVGGLEFTEPSLAAALADSRFADAAAAGATSIVTEDPVCVYHLSARRPAGIGVRNLYECLAAHGA